MALSLLATLLSAAPLPASASTAVAPTAGSFTVRGAGWGHGHGMSQWGAYGAAQEGLRWKEILAYYYPGTSRSTMATSTKLRVWLTADDDGNLRVQPAAGLRVRDSAGHSQLLPRGEGYTSWRISRSGDGYRLAYRTASGTWKVKATRLGTSTWSFAATGKALRLVRPGGSTRVYRGSLALIKRGSSGRTVNTLPLEDYVRAVVPAEMPTSWNADAVKAQAVAARSYAIRTRDTTSNPGYDICDTTACQVYGGRAVEDKAGNAAAKATAGTVLRYRGQVALTQFGASNGGAMADGNLPYLVKKRDRYDGVITSQRWTHRITAASVARAWPSVGQVRQLKITRRDGTGPWGGRVQRIKIVGSKGSVTVSGGTFQYRFGMRSSLFTVS